MTRTVAAARTSAAARTAVIGPIRRVGLVDRNNQPSNGYDDSLAVPTMVCNVNWGDLQAFVGGPLQGSTTAVATLNQTLSTGVWSGGALTVTALTATVNTQAMIRLGATGYLVGVSNASLSGATSLALPPFVADQNYASGTTIYMLLGTAAIDAALAWAATGVGRQIKLRIFGGARSAASFLRSITDPAAVNLPTGVSATPWTVSDKNNTGAGGISGAMWTTTYRQAAQNLWTQVNAKYGSNPYIMSIDGGVVGSSLGVEPMIWAHCVDHAADPAAVNNVYLPSATSCAMAGGSGTKMTTALSNGIADASAGLPNKWVEYANNPYHNLIVGGGTGALSPQIIATQVTTAVTVSGAPWVAHDYLGVVSGNGNYFATIAARAIGKWTVNPQNLTLLTDANANFTAGGALTVVAGDIIYSDGNRYVVTTPITATSVTITTNYDNNGDDTGITYFIVPASVDTDGGGYAITDNTASGCTLNSAPSASIAGLYCLPVGVVYQTGPAGDQTTTRGTFIPNQKLSNMIEANHSPRATTNLVPTTGAPFKDMGSSGVGQPPYAFQTASDANIGDPANTNGISGLWVTAQLLLGSTVKPVDIELPNGYSASYSGTNSGGAGAVIHDANLPGGTNVWGNGNGSLGNVFFTTSKNWYLVTSNTSNSLTCTTTLKAGVDDQAGTAYTVYKWDYVSPAACRQLTASLSGISGARQPINTTRSAS